MKNIILILLIFLAANGQIFSQDLTITRKYAGVIYTGVIDQKININSNVDYMFGLETKYTLFKDNDLFFRSRYSNPDESLGSFWYESNFSELKIKVGYIARQITLTRPHPIGSGGHFEPFPYGKIPGGAPGVDVSLNGKEWSVGLGYSYNSQKQVSEANFGVGFKDEDLEIRGGLVYSQLYQGVAGQVIYQKVKLMCFFESDSLLTNFLFISGPINGYLGSSYDHKEKDWERVEFGLTKNLSASYGLSGVVASGYDPLNKKIIIYFWVYIQ